MQQMDVVVFSAGGDTRSANVGVVLDRSKDGVLLWIPLYDPKTKRLRPWGTVATVPHSDLHSMDQLVEQQHDPPWHFRLRSFFRSLATRIFKFNRR